MLSPLVDIRKKPGVHKYLLRQQLSRGTVGERAFAFRCFLNGFNKSSGVLLDIVLLKCFDSFPQQLLLISLTNDLTSFWQPKEQTLDSATLKNKFNRHSHSKWCHWFSKLTDSIPHTVLGTILSFQAPRTILGPFRHQEQYTNSQTAAQFVSFAMKCKVKGIRCKSNSYVCRRG